MMTWGLCSYTITRRCVCNFHKTPQPCNSQDIVFLSNSIKDDFPNTLLGPEPITDRVQDTIHPLACRIDPL